MFREYLFHIETLGSQACFVSFDELNAIGVVFTLHNHTFVARLLCIGTATANGLACLDADLFLGLFL